MHFLKKHTLDKVASIILAGGQGTRLFPLTQTRCKPSVCFGGKYRLIDIPLSNSLNANIEQIFVISQYFASSLQQHIVETYQLDPFRQTQIHMLCPEQTPERKLWFKGTADAIRQNREQLEASDVDYFLILSGDQLYNIDFVDMIRFAKAQDADLTIACIPVEIDEARRMGLLKINPSQQILSFTEKPSDPALLEQYQLSKKDLQGHALCHPDKTHYLASMGIYVFKKEALLDLVLNQGDDFGKDLIPLSVTKEKTSAYVYKGYWEDIGTIGSYYHANMALLSQNHCLNTCDPLNPIFAHPHNLPSPRIKHTQIHNSLIGQGSIIEAKEVINSIIGINLKVEENTIIRNSILLGSLFNQPPGTPHRSIGHDCHIENTIVDEEAQIGNRVELRNTKQLQTFDGEGIFIRDGIIIVASGTQLPDGFTL